ncbi:FAD-dependent oxidoreductase [Rhodoblastus acidophilus]|uniref:Tryptophan 2-monooxygenase n=1 Tax=Candidatus Rhodoblastus alkanivorans TaxID=2954117 RepID=A0ABS9Z6G7_9HYPH|nr:NAD(P)/FAD-dependent oxidoreductase [Candidatus Rhodoblastus alkanivorans]MCI4677587.1 FAD-dependent oxidoreductase [Candidatus Rhodoblastus alkanivorans]MCI4682681.1 FAD-dependent oxidoreductase [Candidatus Rhodoblastus alkanivorans]MDI4639988.1 FAD-dependent oxidoreductase [Rhodoblastus acidophilus]
MMDEIDVAIIGAGAAGIAAARRLAWSPLSSIVLEASPRRGGRARTERHAAFPLDLGCEWLHSADRNPLARLAEAAGVALDRRPAPWHGQYADLGFSASEQAAASEAFANWSQKLRANPPASDCAADALAPEGAWNAFIRANVSYISGMAPERISAADYATYEIASTGENWRAPSGYGALIAGAAPPGADIRLSTPVRSIGLGAPGVTLATPRGDLRARAVIITVSTAVLASGALVMPAELEPWRVAASLLPLGRNEKVFLEIVGRSPFAPETHVFGDPRDAAMGSYLIQPHGLNFIECFLGGVGAALLAEEGPQAGFVRAADQLAGLFGADVRKRLLPLAATGWSAERYIGGAYSCAMPRHAAARQALARPFDNRIFFAGEAAHERDFTTAHGAYATGVRAAEDVLSALAV